MLLARGARRVVLGRLQNDPPARGAKRRVAGPTSNVVVSIEGDVLGLAADAGDDVGGSRRARRATVDAKRGHIALPRFDGVEVEELTRARAGFAVDVSVMRIPVAFKLLTALPTKVGAARARHLVAAFVFLNPLTTHWALAAVPFDVCGRGCVGDLFFVLTQRFFGHFRVTATSRLEHRELLLSVEALGPSVPRRAAKRAESEEATGTSPKILIFFFNNGMLASRAVHEIRHRVERALEQRGFILFILIMVQNGAQHMRIERTRTFRADQA